MTTYYNYLGEAMAVSASPATTVTASGDSQTITAPPGPSEVSAYDTATGVAYNYDTFVAGNGDNTFVVNNTDVVQAAAGLSGVKTVESWQGGYTLPANFQNLYFFGQWNWGAGNTGNNLIVMSGDDHATLDGGGGNDVLVGALDAENNFQFETGLGGGANHDVFYNFHPGLDTVRIAGAGFTSFSQIVSDMTQATGPDGKTDVVLTIDANDSITFRDTTIAQMQPSDFLLPLDTSQLGPLTFSDNFASLQLFNASTGQGNWQTNYGGDLTKEDAYTNTSNNEKELYTAPNFVSPEDGTSFGNKYNPFSTGGGGLTITAGQISYADSQHLWGAAYYSGMLNTRDVFMQKYGYFDMRAELPTTLGTWPAFWLSQNPYKPGVEADVLEHLAMYPDIAMSRSNDAGTVTGHTAYIPQLSGFHDYGMLWTPATTTFYIDNLAVMQVATPASWDQPMYMLLNMALGGWGGPIDAAHLPAQMQVQYVHAYGLAQSPVEVSEGWASYTAPAGVNTINLLGSGQTVTANDAGDAIVSDNGGNHLIGGTGNDTLTLGGGGDVAAGGGGADAFLVNAVPATASVITDFSASDRLDLSGLLTSLNYAGSNAVADGVIKFADDGQGDAQVWADASGAWTLVTTLDGVSASSLALNGGTVTETSTSSAGSGGGSTGGTSGGGTGGGSTGGGSTGGGSTGGGSTGGGSTLGGGGSASGSGVATTAHDPLNIDHTGWDGIIFRNASSGDMGYMSASPSGGQSWDVSGATSAAFASMGVGDFNGDGATDVALRNTSTGDWGFMTVSSGGGETWHAVGQTSNAFAAIGVGDMGGTGSSDIVFQNRATGDIGYMSVTASGTEQWHPMGQTSTAFTPYGTGDFLGNGQVGELFRNTATGDIGFMTANPAGGETWHAIGQTSTAFSVVGIGDFDGSGQDEVAFRDAAGDWGYMSANPGGGETWHAVGASAPSWNVLKVGDFDNSGHAELAFRDPSSGQWGYLSPMPGGGETWHQIGATSLEYYAV